MPWIKLMKDILKLSSVLISFFIPVSPSVEIAHMGRSMTFKMSKIKLTKASFFIATELVILKNMNENSHNYFSSANVFIAITSIVFIIIITVTIVNSSSSLSFLSSSSSSLFYQLIIIVTFMVKC